MPSRVLIFTLCPRRELNPHSRCGEQDFKSCVSTNSTTRAHPVLRELARILEILQKKSHPDFTGTGLRAKDRARTGHPDLGKVVLYQMSYFRLSVKISIRQIIKNLRIAHSNFNEGGAAKIRNDTFWKKYKLITYTVVYKVSFPESSLLVFENA